jgi:enoyl-CoA hydratase/carnithine racemase
VQAEEAKEHGFVSRVFETREEMCERALETAQQIAANSPIAVIGTR